MNRGEAEEAGGAGQGRCEGVDRDRRREAGMR